ncbi:MAG: DMT family transporter [Pseudomonadota bacterium]
MVEQRNMSNRAWAELLLLGLIWGASFFSIAIALREVGALTSVAHRVGWAAVLLWIVVLWRGHRVPRNAAVWMSFLGMGIFNNVLPFSLMAWGQLHIETGLTSILNAATALFGVLVAAMFLRDERLTMRKAAGTALGFAGVATVIGYGAVAAFDLRSLGQIAVIAGTISYAFASVWGRIRLAELPPEVAAAGMLTCSAIITLPTAWIVDGPLTLALQRETWLSIGYYAGAATAGAYLLYYRILAMAGAGNLMLVTLLIPPVAIALGALFLGETLEGQDLIGFALIALGLVVLDGRALRMVRGAQATSRQRS